MRHRKVQCVRPSARPGEDDVQANLDACKGRVPRQKEECIGTIVTFHLIFLTKFKTCDNFIEKTLIMHSYQVQDPAG